MALSPKGDSIKAAAPVLDDELHGTGRQNLRTIVEFLLPHMRTSRWLLLGLTAGLLAGAVINLCFPLATQLLIDEGLAAPVRNLRVVGGVLAFLGVAAMAVIGAGVAVDYLSARVSSVTTGNIRQELFTHLHRLSMPFFTRNQTGEVLSRFSGDIVALEGMLATVAALAFVPLLEVCYSLCLLFYFNVWLGLIASLIFPLTLFGPRLFGARAFALSYQKRCREGELLSAVHENVAGQRVVKAFGLANTTQQRFNALNRHWTAVASRVHFLAAMVERSSTAGVYFVHLLSFGLGAYWVYAGHLTLGTLVAFEGTFLSMGYAMASVTEYAPVLAQAAGSVHHINELLAERPELEDTADATPLPAFQREIAICDVGFRYGESVFQLRDIHARIEKGSFTVFVGASGSGKSTLLALLLRFYDPKAGSILVDGLDLRTVTQDSLRAQIGMVFQENYLFNTTILENIRVGDPDADERKVEAAARAAEIHDFVNSLPAAYHSLVGEGGAELSGGQRQRLAIARALVRNPAILLLDEATSALDYATEAALNQTLMKIARNRTVIMVTHRLSSVVAAANIIVLDHGRIVEQGAHAELMARDGTYRALWRKQRGDEPSDTVPGHKCEKG